MPGVRVFSIFVAITPPSGKHSASAPAVRRPHGSDAGLQAGRTSQAQLVRSDGSTRGANHVLVDPGDEPCGVQLGDGVHDLQAVALLADHLLDGPRPILGQKRGQDSLWIGGTHGFLLWLKAREDCSGRVSQAGRLLAWLARREFALSVPRRPAVLPARAPTIFRVAELTVT